MPCHNAKENKTAFHHPDCIAIKQPNPRNGCAMANAVIILAAGKGTRMKSDLPKVLHKIAGAPMLIHAMQSSEAIEPSRMIIVAGHGADQVEKAALDYNPAAQIVIQKEQNGTADAANQARDILKDFKGDAVVLFGDTPFISPETLTKVFEARESADVVVLGFEAADPMGYGRLITDGGRLLKITETKDCTTDELKISLCNSGVMAAKSETLFSLIDDVSDDNSQGELYLTDIVGIANDRGMKCAVVTCPEAETLGINSRAHLAEAEAIFQNQRRKELMDEGVTLTDPATTFLAFDTHIGRDVIIGPNTLFGPGVTVETGAHIKGFCHLEGCHISQGAEIGPFARLRPGAEIGDNARVGNFVEIKNSELATGAKVGHLTYLGDASIGAESNIGAGTVTCNYDGVFKHRTEIGRDVFIGTHTSLVAPVTVGDGAFTATGSVITKDISEGDMAIGRGRQVNKPGLGAKFMERLRALKKAGKRP